jgi:hypothetical protein
MSRSVRGRGLRSAAAIAVALAFVAGPRDASGDYEETEERLKLAGVADDVRARIHRAIDDGVAYLLSRQSRDGAFRAEPEDGGDANRIDGHTALASLALAHAGGARARAGAEAGLAYLVPGGEIRKSLLTYTYDAGAAAMLVAALHGDAKVARRIGWSVAAGCRQLRDWWGYGLDGAPLCDADFDTKPDDENLSTSQFAALGLWAAGRQGGVSYPVVWRRHLESLCALQTEDGSWPYSAARPGAPRGGYPNGTCMGFANLTLAAAALEDDLPDDPVLAARTEIARRRAHEALDRDGSRILGVGGARAEAVEYYGLYALEKACVFAGVERVGGRPWYLVGAGRLVAAQQPNGGWGDAAPMPVVGRRRAAAGATVEDTSFALLFLLRASETFRPGTPRDVDGPVTPSSVAPRAGPPSAAGPPSSPEAMTPAAADAALDRLEALVRDRHALTGDLLRSLGEVQRAQAALGAAAGDAWREREEHLLLRAFDDALKPTSPRRDADVAVRAAQALGGTRPAVAPTMRLALGDALRLDDVRPPSRAVLGAAFGALARLGGEESFGWMTARVTDSMRAADVRAARAAMGAFASFEGVGATDRLRAATRIAHLLEPIERAASDQEESEFRSLVARTMMDSMGAAGLAALEHLCADARTGEPPSAADGAPLLTFAAWSRWTARHRDAAAAPWK